MADGAASRFVVLSGPAGVGKSTVVSALRRIVPDLYFSVSMTTRPPRPGEVDGKDYLFVSPEVFQDRIDSGDMLEWADIHGGMQRSGTPRQPVAAALSAGRPVLCEVDLAGARSIRSVMSDARLVFLAPPNWEVLVERLTARGTEDQAAINRRLETARNELAAQHEFDVVVVNDDVDGAIARIAAELGHIV